MKHVTQIGLTSLCLALLVVPCMAWADGLNDSAPLALDDVTVQAPRPATAKPEVVTREEMEQPSVSDTILEDLIRIPGLQLRRTAVSGNESGKLRMRGFDETRLRILKNGVPIHRDGSYGNGPVDWSTLNPNSVESVQIYKGAVPAKYGNTLGGVVDISTRSPEEGLETEIRGLYGSHATHEEVLTHMGRNSYGSWFVSGGHYETDGFLRNNTVDRNHGELDLSVNLPMGLSAGAGVCWSKYETGMPVYNRPNSPTYDGGEPDADERELGGPSISSRLINGAQTWGDGSFAEDENTRVTAWVEKEIQRGHLRLDYLTWSQDREETYVDAADPSKVIYKRETEAEPGNWSLQAEGELTFGNHTIETGGETRSMGWGDQTVTEIDTSYFNGSIHSPYFAFIKEGFKGQEEVIDTHALYLQDTWRVSPRWTLEAGLRQEWFKADAIAPEAFGFPAAATPTDLSESNLSPRAALSFRPWKGGELSCRLGIAHRYPTSPEYFWWYLNRSTGFFNTELAVEEARQAELGFTQEIAHAFTAEIRGYHYDIDDYIASTMVPGTGTVIYNIEEVTIQGAELALSAPLPFNLFAWGNLTWQEGDTQGDPWDRENSLEGQIPDFPEIMANAGLDYRLDDRFTAGISVRHVGERDHLKGATLETLDAYTVVGLNASLRLFQNKITTLRLLASADNLFDEEYEEEAGYPMPDATYTVGLSAVF
ncbi:tonb-dependent receptor beta-barrel [Desulfoluna butyratoxydans]|uniref:Tonb-dependent receptor beta-barrel n=2 Tax=Desulfoluna butyratoxydans TaxID=231438 RepID=A0A4U8YS49_9BACT|nr:tonb-dependent receptor beta-barrel [Desulfoluna butyratoxydans]